MHEGPVPAGPRSELLDTRAAFLSACGWGSRSAIRSSLERRDEQFLDALRGGSRVVLWFEHDLYDQLQLVDALALSHDAGLRPHVIAVDSFPGRPSFRGLGELTPAELETLWPSRAEATSAATTAAATFWEAFREPEPTALVDWADRESPALPFLGRAVLRLLEELPAPGDGLSGTERRALQAIAGGARTPQAAFVAAQDLEPAPFLGDAWFFRTLSVLGRGPVRLIETHGDPVEVRLTSEGERALAGEIDRAELIHLDRWLGGTHITGRNLWRWDPGRPRGRPGRLVQPER